MSSRKWIIGWGIIVLAVLAITGGLIYVIDPFMHYRAPKIEQYYYVLDNQRSQNDGIIKYFEYDAMILGTSMTENFKTSLTDELFGTKSVKVSSSGATYKEVGDSIKKAIAVNPNLKLVIRGLDMSMFFDDKDRMRTDLGSFPTYLYDENPFNDVEYLLNRDVVLNRGLFMALQRLKTGFRPGITSFDEYANWQTKDVLFGRRAVIGDGLGEVVLGEPVHLSESERNTIQANITQNITSIANKNPDVTFYCFYTPYSAVFWRECVENGTIYKQIEAEEYITSLILECDNIRLYSFNNVVDITTNLDNYKDYIHYGEWVNDQILVWMSEGKYQLTKENYKDYIREELNFYLSFDYEALDLQ